MIWHLFLHNMMTLISKSADAGLNRWGKKFAGTEVEILKDIPYGHADLRQNLDIYRFKTPKDKKQKDGPQPLKPVLFMIHGGGFAFFSKETQAAGAAYLAREGNHLVVSINYRLAPRHSYPCGWEDVKAAYQWVLEHIAQYGGNPLQIAVSGDSAGANFALSLYLWLKERQQLTAPTHLILNAGYLQVAHSARFYQDPQCPSLIANRLNHMEERYFKNSEAALKMAASELRRKLKQGVVPSKSLGDYLVNEQLHWANPLLYLECVETNRDSTKIWITIGDRDPVMQDSLRVAKCLKHHPDGLVELRIFSAEGHVFHLFPWKKRWKEYWKELSVFLSDTGI